MPSRPPKARRSKGRPRDLSDISWFDLAKYRDVKKLDVRGWYVQLFLRFCLIDLFENEKFPAAIIAMRNKLWSKLQCNPIVTLDANEIAYLTKVDNNALGYFLEDSPAIQTHAAVAPLTLERLVSAYDALLQEHRKCPSAMRDLPIKHLVGKKFARYDFIVIDLLSPDRLIEKQFAKRLKAARVHPALKSEINQDRTASDLKKWAREPILPFLDLLIFSKETGKRVYYTALENEIYKAADVSTEEDPYRDTIARRTLRKNALHAISKMNLHRLKAAAAQKC